jgi:probable rRNA maturation factor
MPTLLGDVLVCPAIAVKQAPTHAGNLDDELALLIVHGCLHVLGFDHDNETSLAEMRAIEVAVLSAHHWNGPVPDGFRQGHDE